MATCHYCYQPVDSMATRCPHCTSQLEWGGLPVRSSAPSGELTGWGLLFSVFFGVAVYLALKGHFWWAGASIAASLWSFWNMATGD